MGNGGKQTAGEGIWDQIVQINYSSPSVLRDSPVLHLQIHPMKHMAVAAVCVPALLLTRSSLLMHTLPQALAYALVGHVFSLP